MYDTSDLEMVLDYCANVGGFWKLPLDKKKDILNQMLVEYTLVKMKTFKFRNSFQEDREPASLETLLCCIDGQIASQENKRNFFDNYTEYLLKTVTRIHDNHRLTWTISDEEKYIKHPCVVFNGEQEWEELVTHEETPPIYATLETMNKFKEISHESASLKRFRRIKKKH